MEQHCNDYPSNLKDYLREVKYIENINKHFEFIVCDIWDRKSLFIECRNVVDYYDYVKRFNFLYELIKDFSKKIEFLFFFSFIFFFKILKILKIFKNFQNFENFIFFFF